LIPRILFFLLFISSCSPVQNFAYEIKIQNQSNLDTKLLISTSKNIDGSYDLIMQAFPKSLHKINNYNLVLDMTFREDYENDFNDVCIGPYWGSQGPGEIKITLAKSNNFKYSIRGSSTDVNDRCKNYFYYVRFFQINLDDGSKVLVGSATDYAENYPNAPNYWLLNENNEVLYIGTTNIKKYSLNFDLSK